MKRFQLRVSDHKCFDGARKSCLFHLGSSLLLFPSIGRHAADSLALLKSSFGCPTCPSQFSSFSSISIHWTTCDTIEDAKMTTISAHEDSSDEEPSEAIKDRLIDDFLEFSGVQLQPMSDQDKRDTANDFLRAASWVTDAAVENYMVVFGQHAAEIPVERPKNIGGTGESSGAGSSSIEGDDEALQNIPVIKSQKKPLLEVTLDSSDSSDSESTPKKMKKKQCDFKIMTYNISGSNVENRLLRAEAVCRVIRCTKADIVLLQDVVPSVNEILTSKLSDLYAFISSEGNQINGTVKKHPFSLSLFLKPNVQLISYDKVNYESTNLSRTMLTATVKINGVNLNVINTHLEDSIVHVEQFEQCYKLVSDYPKQEPVIVAGDLIMNDEEWVTLGGLPPDFIDSWDATGKKRECMHTLTSDTSGTACRRDRILLRNTDPSRITPVLFNLVGTERLKPEKCFPSDHYGVLCVFSTSSAV